MRPAWAVKWRLSAVGVPEEFGMESSETTGMQFGIFTVGDVTSNPTTGSTPTETQRIQATVAIARKAEEVGLDV